MQNLNNMLEVMPGIDEIKIYFSQRGMSVAEAEQYYRFYEQADGKTERAIFLKIGKAPLTSGF